MSDLLLPFRDIVEAAARSFHVALEARCRELMEAEGLTEAEFAGRAVIVTWPNGKTQLTLDGKPRVEWEWGPAHDRQSDD